MKEVKALYTGKYRNLFENAVIPSLESEEGFMTLGVALLR